MTAVLQPPMAPVPLAAVLAQGPVPFVQLPGIVQPEAAPMLRRGSRERKQYQPFVPDTAPCYK